LESKAAEKNIRHGDPYLLKKKYCCKAVVEALIKKGGKNERSFKWAGEWDTDIRPKKDNGSIKTLVRGSKEKGEGWNKKRKEKRLVGT